MGQIVTHVKAWQQELEQQLEARAQQLHTWMTSVKQQLAEVTAKQVLSPPQQPSSALVVRPEPEGYIHSGAAWKAV